MSGDGVGDLTGLISRLDYMRWLGVDAVWISPLYPSPMKDFGYDVADYTAIHPLFLTIADFDQLIGEAHARDLKVILDFVPNHSSDQHLWFIQSRSSRGNPKRNWYIWHDPGARGGLPNNWLSCFGGSAWEFDAHTGQYYYHPFCANNRTSTGAIPKSSTRCWMCCASGWSAASTAFALMSSGI
jgi:alpha-glucosidase